MTITNAVKSINDANSLIQCAQLIQQAAALATTIASENTTVPMGNGFGILNTITMGPDGGLSGATPDSTPVSTHPVNPNLYPTLSVALTPLQMNQLLVFALTIPTFAAGSAVSASGVTPALLAAVNPSL